LTPIATQTLPTPTSHNLVTWRDPKDNRFYAAVALLHGRVALHQHRHGRLDNSQPHHGNHGRRHHHLRDHAVEDHRERATTSSVIVGIMANGDVVQYEQTVLSTTAGFTWKFDNLSDDLRAIGASTPTFQGRLIAYTTAWDAWHIAGLDAGGQIQTIWRGPRMTQWVLNNLSTITGAPALTGGLTVYLTTWKGINLAGVDSSGNLRITWWIPRFEGTWVVTDLSSAIEAPAIEGESIVAFNTPAGGLNIAARTSDDKIVVFWWVPGAPGNQWRVQNISDAVTNVENPIIPGGELSAVAGGDGVTSIVGRGPDGAVIRYYGSVIGETWFMEDLSDGTTVV
jgi:hypothetical protein